MMFDAGSGARHGAAAALVAAAAISTACGSARGAEAPSLHAAALAGAFVPDNTLERYRWDVRPLPLFGVETRLETRGLGVGARLWRTETTQASGMLGESRPVTVNLTSWSLLGERRVFTVAGVRVGARLCAGRIHLRYDPDRVAFEPFGSGEAIVVDYTPVDEWILGGGVAIDRPIGEKVSLGLEIEHFVFAMETAHRNGEVIDVQRESFGSWSANVRVGWRIATI
jgi:hypothetical protein